MMKSDFEKVFVGERGYNDTDSALSFFAQPDQMKICKQQFERNIQASVSSILRMYEQCIRHGQTWEAGQTWASISHPYGWLK